MKKPKLPKDILPLAVIFAILAYIGWVYIGLQHIKIMGGVPDRFIEPYVNAGGEEVFRYNWPYIKEFILWVVLFPLGCTLLARLFWQIRKRK